SLRGRTRVLHHLFDAEALRQEREHLVPLDALSAGAPRGRRTSGPARRRRAGLAAGELAPLVQLPAKLGELGLERADLAFELLQDLRCLRADRTEEIRLLASGHVLLLLQDERYEPDAYVVSAILATSDRRGTLGQCKICVSLPKHRSCAS